MLDHPLISADDHLDLDALAPTVFTEGVVERLKSRVPYVVESDAGAMWMIEGRTIGPSGSRPQGQLTREELGRQAGDAKARLALMDRDRVQTQVIYGPAMGFTFTDDQEIRLACTQAFNDHLLEFGAVDPKRLVPLALMPGQSSEAATAELLRCVRAGHRGVLLPQYETDWLPFGPEWENFWAAANETRIPVHFHLGGNSSRLSRKLARKSWTFAANVAIIAMQMSDPLAALIFSGTFDRNPNVKVIFGESGIGWLPYLVERMDATWKKYEPVTEDVKLQRLPSEYFGSHVLFTYEEDDIGIENLDVIGASAVMWASDFPHGDTTWPRSHEIIANSALSKVDEKKRRMVLYENAAHLYGLN